ncbi:CoB--CoM heterodisulfide reductase subunit C [Methanomassiliicoccus luminyensis]|jgi:heterodisulfide reductase subunit C|uniref:CoB--CoM heterodisulfide reductase subunit C n=1 Tax=Methanomassiliicoccus luminyensis TaxID=1080712 RepID=UPI00036EBF63|nr:CoB--CoM heterodisulfide reductase subunit C [Methanomassiliicoccus luminyensis]
MLCFQCGTCTASCPSGRMTAYKTRKLIRKAQLGLKDDIINSPDLWMCTTCYACMERCPRGVEIVDIITILRNNAVQAGIMSGEHRKVGQFLLANGATVPLNEKYEDVRAKLGLPRRPANTLGDKKALEDFQKVLKATGFDKLLEGGK